MTQPNAQAVTFYNKALAQNQKGNKAKAIQLYRKAINQWPNFIQALNNLANLYLDERNFAAAKDLLNRASHLDSENFIILNNLGRAYLESNDLERSHTYLLRAFKLKPTYLPSILNYAVCLDKQHKPHELQEFYEKLAPSLKKDFLIPLSILKKASNTTLISYLERILLHNIKALIELDLTSLNQLIESLNDTESSIFLVMDLANFAYSKSQIDFADLIANSVKTDLIYKREYLLYKADRLLSAGGAVNESFSIYKKLHHEDPKDELAISGLINCYFYHSDLINADKLLTKLSLHAREANLYYLWKLFRENDLSKAWEIYNKNLAKGSLRGFSSFTDITFDSPIYVYRDQGIGDEIMFYSCLNDLSMESNQPITVECDPRLNSILERSFPAISKFTSDFDSTIANSIPLSALPSRYRTHLHSFAFAKSPYISHDSRKSEAFSKLIFKPDSNLTVGIAWKGGSSKFFGGQQSVNKSCSLKDFSPILKISGINFVSLQYGNVEDELRAVENDLCVKVSRWPDLDLTNDFESVASLISSLDLVIQTSNASIHLAGACGKRSWCLLGPTPDWRWFSNGVDDQSAWYPSVKMIKKNQNQSWEELVESLVPELTALAASKS